MQLQLQNFSQLVASAATAVQGSAAKLIDLTVGSTLRAILEANASMALWLQWLILQVLRTTRAATSIGSDLDSWMADYAFARLPGVPAHGTVTFARFAPASAALVPVGATVRTADASQSFVVTADTGNTAFDATQNGYVLAAGTATVTVPVTAVVAGGAGNVQPNAATLIAAALPGVDTVSNAAAFQGGQDSESDSALRVRFQNFLSSRSRATLGAVGYVISSLQQGMQYTVQENTLDGINPSMGGFLVTVDDGTGAPAGALLAAASQAIDAVRPVGSRFLVQPPTVLNATISLVLSVAPNVTLTAAIADVTAAILGTVNALPIGAPLAWSRLTQIAYAANAGVVNVTGVQLNGGTADLVVPASAVIKTNSVMVT